MNSESHFSRHVFFPFPHHVFFFFLFLAIVDQKARNSLQLAFAWLASAAGGSLSQYVHWTDRSWDQMVSRSVGCLTAYGVGMLALPMSVTSAASCVALLGTAS